MQCTYLAFLRLLGHIHYTDYKITFRTSLTKSPKRDCTYGFVFDFPDCNYGHAVVKLEHQCSILNFELRNNYQIPTGICSMHL